MGELADRIWRLVVDTYADNLWEREQGTIVVTSHWERDMKQAIGEAVAVQEAALAEAQAECERLRADAALGAMVETLPMRNALIRDSLGWWRVDGPSGITVACSNPADALRAAGLGGDE